MSLTYPLSFFGGGGGVGEEHGISDKVIQHITNRLLLRRANARNVSLQISLRGPIHITNPVDKTKLSRINYS